MITKLLAGAGALVLLLGVPAGAELYAGRRLQGETRVAASHLAPGARVVRADPHGRPLVTALLGDEISSAYVDVRTPGGTTHLILQRLDRRSGRASTVLWFPRLRQPVALTPDLTPGGAYTPSGSTRLRDREVHVTYAATVQDGTVRVRPQGVTVDGRPVALATLPPSDVAVLTPAPLTLPAAPGTALTVRAVSVGENDITVELRQHDADVLAPAPAA